MIKLVFGSALLISILFAGCTSTKKSPSQLTTLNPNIPSPKEEIIELTSPAFKANDYIPAKYTCDGENVSPPLQVSAVPNDAQSLVLIVDDPDAPGGDWIHWLVWNIDPKVETILSSEVPLGAIQGLNSFGDQSYGGPCPPSGTHRYQFKLFALDTTLDLSNLTNKTKLLEAIKTHILSQTMLVGLYKRQ
jgi:Raf kinase inhibitor-like YbhB/YbcL family protein